jgi:hypothetical protein
MNNRPHKKEKAKKRSKDGFVEKAIRGVRYSVSVVHFGCSKTDLIIM